MASHCYEKEGFRYETFSNHQVKLSVFEFHRCQKFNPMGRVENRIDLHLKIFRVTLFTEQPCLCKYTFKGMCARLDAFKQLLPYFLYKQ